MPHLINMSCTVRRAFLAIGLWCALMHVVVAGMAFGTYYYLSKPIQEQYVDYNCTLLSRGSVNTQQVSPLFINIQTYYRIYWQARYEMEIPVARKRVAGLDGTAVDQPRNIGTLSNVAGAAFSTTKTIVEKRSDSTIVEVNTTLVTPWVENRADLRPYLELPARTVLSCWGPPQNYEVLTASPKNWPNPLRVASAQWTVMMIFIVLESLTAFGAIVIYALAQYSIARDDSRREYAAINGYAG